MEDLKAAFEAEAIDYITKPPSQVELLARVSSALKLKRETDQRKAHELALRRAYQQEKAMRAQLVQAESSPCLCALRTK